MNTKEKMLAGKIYEPFDTELIFLREKAHKLNKEYNDCFETDKKRAVIINELVKHIGKNVFIQGPIQFDYGCFTTIDDNCFINFNFTCLDCCPVTIGKNVFIGPNVALLTPLHPLLYQDRNMFQRDDGTMSNVEYARPIIIEDNCWIAGNVTICGGVTISEGSVIGAGSVVTRDIPSGVLAAGNPCKVIRALSEKDKLTNLQNLY